MAKLVVELSPTDIGHVLGDFTWDFCTQISTGGTISITGATLTELGNGCYILYNPNVVADTAFRLHLTASTSHFATGIFSLADDNMALANADFNSTQKTSLNAATPASVQNIAAQTGDAYAQIGIAGAGLTALGDTRIANLDTTISSRLTPGGTLATVTNLINAPTSGDMTATMKASVTTALNAAAVTLAASQPNYAPSKAGDAMALTIAYDAAKTAASAASVAAIPTNPLLATDSRMDYLNSAVGSVAASVWDVPVSGHLTSGSTGASINASGSAGDPWSTVLPGVYGAGTAGSIVGSRLDVAVSSRNDVAPDNGNIANIIAAINDGTYGLSALMTAIGASGSGENDTAILSAVNVLDARLTDARAALIDKLATPAAPTAPVIVIPTPLAGNLQTLWGQAKELGSAWAAGDTVTVTPKSGQVIGGVIISDEIQTTTVDASGFFSVQADKGALVRVEIGDYFRKNITVTTDDSKNLGTY